MDTSDGFCTTKYKAHLYYEYNTILSVEFCLKDLIVDSDVLDPNYITLTDSEGGFYGELSAKKIIQDLRDLANWIEKGPS